MIKADIGDDAKHGGDDIGTVEPSSQSYFYDSNVNVVVAEVLKGHCGGNLKEGGTNLFEKGFAFICETHHIIFRDGLAVDTNSLAEISQMWRCVQAYFVTANL